MTAVEYSNGNILSIQNIQKSWLRVILEDEIKRLKSYSKTFLTKAVSYKEFSKICLAFPENGYNFNNFSTISTVPNTLPRFQKTGFNFATQKFVKKEKECYFQMVTTFVDLKVASKPFSKNLTMKNFWFRQFSRFCFVVRENSLDFVTQKLAQNGKLRIIVFDLTLA